MWSLLYCCVILAIANPLGLQALPHNISSVETTTDRIDVEPTPECPENEFFNPEGTSCELTCEMPVAPAECNAIKAAGCQCNDGLVRNGTGACVNQIACLDNIPFDVDGNVTESTSHRVTVDEFMLTANETQATESSTEYPVDDESNEYDDPIVEEAKLILKGIIDLLRNDISQEDSFSPYEQSYYPEIETKYASILRYLVEIVDQTRKDSKLYENSESLEENYLD